MRFVDVRAQSTGKHCLDPQQNALILSSTPLIIPGSYSYNHLLRGSNSTVLTATGFVYENPDWPSHDT